MLDITNGADDPFYKIVEQAAPALKNPLKSFLEDLWEKITQIASKIFSCFFCDFGTPDFFTAREIKLLRDDRRNKTPLKKTSLVITFPKGSITEVPKSNAADPLREEPPYVVFDDTLEQLRAFVRDFSILVSDVIYEKHLAAHIQSTQAQAPNLPPLIKNIAKLIVEMGDKAAKPLFKKFSEQKAKTIDPALQKIFKTLLKSDQAELNEKLSKHLKESISEEEFNSEGISISEYINPLLNWFSLSEEHRKTVHEHYPKDKNFNSKLIEKLYELALPFWEAQIDAEKTNLHEYLEKQLWAEFRDTKVPLQQSIEFNYIDPILTWLLLMDPNKPLILGNMDKQKEELIDSIFEKAITLIVERKIDQYSRFLEKTIQGQLDTIIQKTLQKNAARIADFFSERLCELINTMPFTNMVEELIHETLSLQISGIIESKKAYKEEKKIFKKAEKYSTLVPGSPESLEAIIFAENHLHSVNSRGGKKAYLERRQLADFISQPGCSLYLQQMIKQELELVDLVIEHDLESDKLEKDTKTIRRVSEKALYNTLAENILNLMIPSKKKLNDDGTVEETDPFMQLWDRLYLPEEFYDLEKQCEQLVQEFVTPETTSILESIRSPTEEIVKSIFKSTVKDFLSRRLIQIVQNVIEKITLPEKINELMSESVFNSLNLMLVEIFCKQLLVRNLSEFAPLFHQLKICPDEEKDEKFRILQNALIKLAKGSFVHFNPDKFSCSIEEQESLDLLTHPMTAVEWLDLTRNIISEIDVKIQQSEINHLPFDPQSITCEEITDILKKIFAKQPENNNPEFGKLAVDLIFGLGKLDNKVLFSWFSQNNTSRAITESIWPWQESYHKFIEKLTVILKRKFLHPEAARALFIQENPKPEFHVKQKLAHQINVTASLTYDIIKGIANAEGSVTSFAASYFFLSDSPDKLNRVISKIYKSLFNNTMINQNLVANASKKIFQAFVDSAQIAHNVGPNAVKLT